MKKYRKTAALCLTFLMLFCLLPLEAGAVDAWYTDLFVRSGPAKTEYVVGESFDPAGLVLQGHVEKSDGSSAVYTTYDYDGGSRIGLSVSPSQFTKAGSITVELAKEMIGKDGTMQPFECTVTVTVKEADAGKEKQEKESQKKEESSSKTAPELTKSPSGETVSIGGSCSFICRGNNVSGYDWYIRMGYDDFTTTDAVKEFAPLRVKGAGTEKLILSKIPIDMDGCQIYCVLTSPDGLTVTSKSANLTVADTTRPPLQSTPPARPWTRAAAPPSSPGPTTPISSPGISARAAPP